MKTKELIAIKDFVETAITVSKNYPVMFGYTEVLHSNDLILTAGWEYETKTGRRKHKEINILLKGE